MKIKIFRPNQIGGCITEISTTATKILIDMGEELEKSEYVLPIPELLDNCGAVFFSHYHGDHLGLYSHIPQSIPVYMGKTAKKIFAVLTDRVDRIKLPLVERFNTFTPLKKIRVGDITVTPLMVDHSAFDAYMFIIEAEGKRVLHTGDFRTHGFRGGKTFQMLEKYVSDIDVLITEGTMFSRDDEPVLTEPKLKLIAEKMMRDKKYVFVLCSSTNIDRIAAFYHANPKGRLFVCDKYQKDVLDVVTESSANCSSLYDFKYAMYYAENLDSHMREKGFCMLIRQTPYFQKFLEDYRENSLIIYSKWTGYLDSRCRKEELIEFLSPYKYEKLHASGHAATTEIIRLCNTVKPKLVIPIHSDNVSKIQNLGLEFPVKVLEDKEEFVF